MAKYLYNKFKGQYRVLANYDRLTNDFPRTETGEIDPSFDDYYIPSIKYNLEVRHGVRNNLTCYCFSMTQLLNILYKMCNDLCKKNYQRMTANHERVCNALLNNSIITEYELLDGEGYFCFKTEDMSVIAPYLALKTNGANISPLSKKNLPKNKYKIPEVHELAYADTIHKYNYTTVELMQIIKRVNKEFEETLKPAQKELKEKSNMNMKQFASKENLWEQYLNFVSQNLEDYKHYKKNKKE